MFQLVLMAYGLFWWLNPWLFQSGATRFKVNHCECVWQFLWLHKTHKSLWPAWKFNHIQLVFHLNPCDPSLFMFILPPRIPLTSLLLPFCQNPSGSCSVDVECHVVEIANFKQPCIALLWIRQFLFETSDAWQWEKFIPGTLQR